MIKIFTTVGDVWINPHHIFMMIAHPSIAGPKKRPAWIEIYFIGDREDYHLSFVNDECLVLAVNTILAAMAE